MNTNVISMMQHYKVNSNKVICLFCLWL